MTYEKAPPSIQSDTNVTRQDGERREKDEIVNAASPEPSLATKANDLEALRVSVVEAASVSVGLWLSYLFVLFYFLIAAGGVTHRDLFLENPVKLPFLNVDLPLRGFFVLGPGLFLIVHAYILIHFTLLAGKVGVFHVELQNQVRDEEVRIRLRRQLPSNIFVQTLAGPYEVRSGVLGFMLRQIAWITLVGAPIGLLLFFQFQFLAYHHEAFTWWQRLAVVVDLVLVWIFWPSISRGEAIATAWSSIRLRRAKVAGMAIASTAIFLLVFTIATHPGETLDNLPSLRIFPWKSGTTAPWKLVSLHELLVAGEVDFSTRKASSLWSNRLVLPGIDVVDHSKFDTDEKLARMPSPISLRARHLEGAVLIGSTLRRVDFTGSWMQGVTLGASDLREAKFECDTVRQAGRNGPEQRCTQLQGASFVGSSLQASSFVGAQLEGALFYRARLQGASFLGARLNGAALDSAELQGASLDSAHLNGASLASAQLQGAVLDFAELRSASLDGAQLQGVSLNSARLDGASIRKAFAWRADVRKASVIGARVNVQTTAHESCLGLDIIVTSESNCRWSQASFDRLKQLILDQVPKGPYRRDALARIQRLDPTQSIDVDSKFEEAWAALGTSFPSVGDYEKGKANFWKKIGCENVYVLRGLIAQLRNMDVAFSSGSKELLNLVNYFSSDLCPATQTLSETELESLAFLRKRDVPADQ